MRNPARLAVVILLIGASHLSFHPASAAPPPPSGPNAAPGPTRAEDQRALALFEKSDAAYRAGDFQQAVTLLKQAYALTPAPVLLYNLGRAYEGLGDLDDALKAYSDYLAAQPDAPDRGAIEKRVATLRSQIAERDKLRRDREAAEARAAEAPPPEPHRSSVLPWVVAGVGGATVGAGVVFGLLAESRHNTATNDTQQASAAQDQSDAKSLATTANILLVAGGVVAAGGIVWGILSSTSSHSSAQTGAAQPRVRATVGLATVGITVDLP